MKMLLNLGFRENRARVRRWILIFSIFLIILIIVFLFQDSFSELFIESAQPAWIVQSRVGKFLASVGASISSKIGLERENATLKEQNAKILEAKDKISLLEIENELLKDALGRFGSDEVVLATIEARPPRTPYDILLLDVGKEDDVAVGDLVVSQTGTALGKLREVYGRESKAVLFSSSGEEIDALLATTSRAVLVKGKGGGNFEARLPKETPVFSGDLIFLSNIESYVVAEVVDEKISASDPFKIIYARSPVNTQEERFVFVKKTNSQ